MLEKYLIIHSPIKLVPITNISVPDDSLLFYPLDITNDNINDAHITIRTFHKIKRNGRIEAITIFDEIIYGKTKNLSRKAVSDETPLSTKLRAVDFSTKKDRYVNNKLFVYISPQVRKMKKEKNIVEKMNLIP